MATISAPVTVEQFLAMPEPEGSRLELLEGEVFSMGRGGPRHELVKANLIEVLVVFLVQTRLGKVLSESMFRIGDSELIPDVAVIRPERLATGAAAFTSAPDLAIEVVSNETAEHLERKIGLYLAHGSAAVWVLYPEQKSLRVFDRDKSSRHYEGEQAVLCGLLPGFSSPASRFFDGVAETSEPSQSA